MKIASILAGVALAALSASAASAGITNGGQYTIGGTAPHGPVVAGSVATGYNAHVNRQNASGIAPIANVAAWHYNGNSGVDIGTASPTDGATFTLKGAVSPSCIFYSGATTQSMDFGAIGIWADENAGPNNAFRMSSIPYMDIDTNLAGCNTANRVTLSKTNMENASATAAGYDTNVFIKELPFDVTATYTAGATGVAASAGAAVLKILQNDSTKAAEHGAWRSGMAIRVNVPQQAKALVAGEYVGTVSVQLQAL